MLQALLGPIGNLASSWLQGKADKQAADAKLKLTEAEAKAKWRLDTCAWPDAGMGLCEVWKVHGFHFRAKTGQREQYLKDTEAPEGRVVITADFAENLTLPLGPVPGSRNNNI